MQVKTANGKQVLSITREEWLAIGESQGWTVEAAKLPKVQIMVKGKPKSLPMLKALEAMGWTGTRGKTHYVFRCPSSCGQHTISVPKTPSDSRGVLNLMSKVWQCPASAPFRPPR